MRIKVYTDQMSVSESSHQHHNEDDDSDGGEETPRTLFDIIQGEGSGTAYKDLVSVSSQNKKNNRKSFKDRFHLRRSNSVTTSSSYHNPIPTSDIMLTGRRSFNTSTQQHPSPRPHMRHHDPQLPITIDDKNNNDAQAEEENEPPPPQPTMSLMALLEQTDRQAGVVGSTFFGIAEEEEEDDEEDEEEVGDEGGGKYVCCVCMVRHKGAAFIPCGHTFCRLCSRELWVSRGNCPLCNGFILEILDIF